MNEWSTDMPDKCGLWEARCDESDNEPYQVAIYKDEDLGRLIMNCDVTHDYLDVYHYNLCNLEWRKVL